MFLLCYNPNIVKSANADWKGGPKREQPCECIKRLDRGGLTAVDEEEGFIESFGGCPPAPSGTVPQVRI